MVVHRHTAGEGEEVSKVVLWLFTGIQQENGEEVSKVVLWLFTGIQQEKVKKSLEGGCTTLETSSPSPAVW